MKKSIILFSLSVSLFIGGCSIINKKPDEVAAVDLADAQLLGVYNPGHSTDPNNNLIKLTSSDFSASPDPLLFLDADGNILGDNFSQIDASDIITLTESYVLLFGGFTFTLNDGEHYSNALILNTETGSIYDLEDRYFPDWSNWYLGSMYHQTDDDGNIYYGYGGVSRLVIGDDGSIIYENYVDYYEGFMEEEAFFVDKQGNVFFDAGRMVKLASGGIIESEEQLYLFNGFENNIIAFSKTDYLRPKAYYISIEDGELKKELLTDVLTDIEIITYGMKLYSNEEHLVHFLIAATHGLKLQGEFEPAYGLAVFESDNTVYDIFFADDIEVSSVLGIEDHYLWIQSGLSLYAFNLDLYSLNSENLSLTLSVYEQFDIPHGYELQQVRFDRKGMVEFIAYNFNEEKRGKGFISMAHGFEFIDDDSELGSVELTRIR